MKKRVEEMEAEAKKLRELQAAAESQQQNVVGDNGEDPMQTEDDRQAADEKSIYVGNVSFLNFVNSTYF